MFSNIIELSKEIISKLQNPAIEIIHSGRQKEKKWGNLNRVSETWAKPSSILTHLIAIPERKEKEKSREDIWSDNDQKPKFN